MKKRSFLILLWILVVIFGCSTTNKSEKELKNLDSGFEVIKSSKFPTDYIEYTEGEKALLVYHSDIAEDVEKFNVEYELLTGDEAPSFDGNMIIAKSGTKSTGGYDISVESIRDAGRYTEVTIKHKIPGSNCIVITAVTNPYTIVFIPDDHKEVIFIQKSETTNCN
jgi:hypothetical protein